MMEGGMYSVFVCVCVLGGRGGWLGKLCGGREGDGKGVVTLERKKTAGEEEREGEERARCAERSFGQQEEQVRRWERGGRNCV